LGTLRSHAKLVEDVVVVVPEGTICVVGALGDVVASRRGSGTVSGSSRALYVIAIELRGVFPGQSDKFVTLAALWNLDVVLVEPLLDLAVTPAVEKLIAERLLS